MTDTATPATDTQATVAAAAPAAHAARIQVVKPEHTGARVTVLVQPEEKYLSMPRPKTRASCLQPLALPKKPPLWPATASCLLLTATSGPTTICWCAR